MKSEHSNTVTFPLNQIAEVFGMERDQQLKKVIEILTICDAKELSNVLGVSKAHILHLADSLQIPSMAIADKRLFNKIEVFKALERRRNTQKKRVVPSIVEPFNTNDKSQEKG